MSGDEVRRRTTVGVVAVVFRGLGVRLLSFVGTIVLARLLVPAQFGLIALGIAIVTVGAGLANGGLTSALLRGKTTPQRRDLEAVFGVNLLGAMAVVAITAGIGLPLGEAGAVTAVMTLSLPLNVARAPTGIILERTLDYRILVQAELTEVVAYNLWAVATVALGMGVWGVATALVVRAAVGTALVLIRGPVGFIRPRLDLASIRPILGFGIKSQAVEFVNLGRDQGVNVLMAAIGGAAALGFWALAWRLIQTVFVLFEALWRVSFPAIARLIETGEDVRPTVEKALRLASGTTGLILTPLAGTAPVLIPIFFGPTWATTAKIVPLVSLGLMLNGPISAAGIGYLYAQGRAGFVLTQVIVHTLVGLAVTAAAVVTLGAVGVGIGMLAASLVDYGFLAYALGRSEKIAVFRTTLPPFVIALVAGGGTYAVASILSRDILALASAAALAEMSYLLLLILFRRRQAREMASFGGSLWSRYRARGVLPEPA